MPTSIFFDGRRIVRPQAVSKIDASELASLSPSEVGIVALVGTAEGGVPLTVDSTYSDHTRPSSITEAYRSGNLRTAGQFAFEPSSDPAIPRGAARVVAVKVNPAERSQVALLDTLAAPALDITSKDYGLFTEQINVLVESGTTQGRKYTVTFEDVAEVFDNVGGAAWWSLLYTPGAFGYTTALASVGAASTVVAATRTNTGTTTARTAAIVTPGLVTVESSNAADTTQSATIYGVTVGNVAQFETIALNGTAPVVSTKPFSDVHGVIMSTPGYLGTVTVKDAGAVTVWDLAPAVLFEGAFATANTPASGTITYSLDADSAGAVVSVFGLNSAGVFVGEAIDVATAFTTPVTGTVQWSRIDVIATGDLADARTLTLAVNAASIAHATLGSVQKVVDKFNALDGFTATAIVGGASSALMLNQDYVSAQNVAAGTVSFYANNYAAVVKLTAESSYVNAARSAGATSAPANTTAAVFLVGGIEGVATITQWQQAFDLLRTRRVNIIVPLTDDPAVHALLSTHLVARAGALKSEANGYVGIGTGGVGETKANIKSQIVSLQTRHISAVSQEIQRFDPLTGQATFYPPWMHAAIAAGAQAGSAIGEPLTLKRPIATAIRNDSSWNTVDDGDELLDAGLMMLESVDGVGIRWIRSITTHLADDNVVFSEMSANESANTAVFELRRQLELLIGKRGLGGTVATIKGNAIGILNALIEREIIVAHKSLQVSQIGDVYPVSVQIAPVLPTNFIPITVHLVAARSAA